MDPLTKEKVLAICAHKAKRGELFQVHRFKWTRERDRKLAFRMKRDGLLVQAKSANPMLAFYRPEDEPVIEAARTRFAGEMKKIHARNVLWHLEQAEKNKARGGDYASLEGYHLREAEKERLLSI